jgi:hypothetical protein
MAARRRINAVFLSARPVREDPLCGVDLLFRPTSRGVEESEVRDWADLGPEHTLEAARGLATLIRLLRAVRLAFPRPAEAWLGQPEDVAARLTTVAPTPVVLEVEPRFRLHFTAWTEDETIEVPDVREVESDDSAFLVRRIGGALPVRVPRDAVLRHHTERRRWLQVVGIERP